MHHQGRYRNRRNGDWGEVADRIVRQRAHDRWVDHEFGCGAGKERVAVGFSARDCTCRDGPAAALVLGDYAPELQFDLLAP
jgi:hypothetical protein